MPKGKNKLALLFIMDRSGSMDSIRRSVETGMNDIIRDLRNAGADATVDLVQFDTEIEHVSKGVPLDRFTFRLDPRGGTALYDGIVTGVSNLRERIALLKASERPDKVQVVVVTDGQENSSKVADAQLVKDTVEWQSNLGWDFTFLGANQDAVFVSAALGFEGKKAMTFASTASGVSGTANSLSDYIQQTLNGQDAQYNDAHRSSAMGH